MKVHSVPPGTFYVGQSQVTTLTATLNANVGVVLIDRTAGVGGMLNVVSPQPGQHYDSDEVNADSLKYATVGLPKFLESLYSHGASKDNLEVCIAGGALVDPLTPAQLDLNIGGKTVDAVLHTLTHTLGVNKINQWCNETGGLYLRTFYLDMRNWETCIEPVGIEHSSLEEMASQSDAVTPLTDSELEAAIANVQPIPQVAIKVTELLTTGAHDVYYPAIVDEVMQDQVLSGLILKTCNSALISPKHRISSIDYALVYLGKDLFLKLILTTAITRLLKSSITGYSLCKGGLYYHATGTAVIAEKLANLTELVDPALAYTVALLHDIGKVVLDQHMAAVFPYFYRSLFRDNTTLLSAERNIFGTDHCRIGYKVADAWTLPQPIAETILFHHSPQKAIYSSKLVHIVYLADFLMTTFHFAFELEKVNTSCLISSLKALEIDPSGFKDLADFIPISIFTEDLF